MKTLEQAIADVEAAGFYWAIDRGRSDYGAVVKRDALYVGDYLCGPSAQSGATPAEALFNALKHELEYEAKQAARSVSSLTREKP